MDDSGAETLITSDALWVQKMRKVAERIKRIILARPLDYTPKEQPPKEYPGTMDFRKMVESHKPEPPEVKFEPKEDVAILGYTGGTTGLPKGVILTHWNRVVNTLQGASWYAPVVGEEFSSEPSLEDLPREPAETGIAVTPWCHAMGFSGLSTRLAVAATAIILPEFDPRKYLELIQKYKPRGVGGVPTLFNFLLSHPDFDKYDVSSIKFCVSGAAPLPVETYKEIEKKFDAIVIEGYGLTEATAAAIINPADPDGKRKPGSVGLPLPDTDVKIVDVERGERELPPGEIGELIIKGPQVMLGYWKREEETKKALRNGWLYTGDLARMDEDGYFYIVERKKEMLIYKGYNVYPRELEEVLYEHPAVKLCAVIGKPDPKVGEIPKAFVVLKRGKKVTAEELMRFCEERVASYKKIREVEFRSSLPLSFIGKVLKRELQKEENAKR
jgi:long-chain acyl-CoA synthetase